MTLTRRSLMVLGTASVLPAALPGTLAAQELTVEAVLRDPVAPVMGNPGGDVTLVEYFDYQCPYCKAMHPILNEVVAADGGVRLVMKDWPIFGASSVRASQLALGAASLGAYAEVSEALMSTQGRLSVADVDQAVSVAVPVETAMQAFRRERDKWQGLLDRNAFQAQALGFRGTPSFAVETTLYPGALDRETLEAAIAEARAA